jgi:protein-S-isoprenylcysteine O-methyltransferase Ste14
MNLAVYRSVEMIIILTFAFFISDFRKKNKMIPLIDRRLILLLKVCYLIPVGIFIYTVLTMDQIFTVDYFVPIFTVLGTYMVAKAKADLGKYHTWTGYYAEGPVFVTEGIYSVIRHPLYTGIGLFILGSGINVLLHAPGLAALSYTICITYILAFITTSAVRETRRLKEQFGMDFEAYASSVHPFLPLRHYRAPMERKSGIS